VVHVQQDAMPQHAQGLGETGGVGAVVGLGECGGVVVGLAVRSVAFRRSAVVENNEGDLVAARAVDVNASAADWYGFTMSVCNT